MPTIPVTILERNPQQSDQANSDEQALGNTGKKKLPFNRRKLPAEPGSGRGSHLLLLRRGSIERQDQNKLWQRVGKK